MDKLIQKINKLRNSELKKKIDKRLSEFRLMNKKGDREWFSELCFCLLTANTSAEMGLRVQKHLGYEGFTTHKTQEELADRLKNAKSRFYNTRACYIHLANEHKDIKKKLLEQKDKRQWLVDNIKGLSYKEASHFLRNIGFFEYAIIDKHILRLMHENRMIKEIPKSMNKKYYFEYEKILGKLADKVKMQQGELDPYLWYMKTGKVLK